MASIKLVAILLVASMALAAASPIPEPGGGWGKKHTHYIIHVPYHVHTVHHHHVKKVPVYIEKHHPVYIEKHHPVVSHGGWDWD